MDDVLTQCKDRMNEVTNWLINRCVEDHLAWVLGPSPLDPNPFMSREEARRVAHETVEQVQKDGKMLEFCRALYGDEESE